MPAALGTVAVEGQHRSTGSPRCRTCRSPHRRRVEHLLAEGKSYTEVAASLPADAALSHKNVREHALRGHLPVDDEIIRRLVEALHGDHAAVLEIGVAQAVRQLAEASVVVEETTRLLALGAITPTMRDGIRAAKLLAKYDEAVRRDRHLEGQLRDAHEALSGVLSLAKEHTAPDEWSDFLREMTADQRLRPFAPPGFASGSERLLA